MKNKRNEGGMKMICPNCGAEVDDSAKFCTQCGSPMEEVPMFCANCGCKLEEPAAFCPECGAKLGTADYQEQDDYDDYYYDDYLEDEYQEQSNLEQLYPESHKKEAKHHKKGKAPIIAMAVIGILLGAAGVGGAFWFINHNASTDAKSGYETEVAKNDSKLGTVEFNENKKSSDAKVEAEPTATPIPEPTATPEPTAQQAEPVPEQPQVVAATRENTALRPDFYKDGNVTGTSEDYIIPDSVSRYLTNDDIAKLSAKGLCFARNEMIARQGRIFKNQELASYFNSMPWYQGTIDPDTFDNTVGLSDVVSANAELMKSAETALGQYIPW